MSGGGGSGIFVVTTLGQVRRGISPGLPGLLRGLALVRLEPLDDVDMGGAAGQ